MADFEPPSFSLGLDLDTHSDTLSPIPSFEPSPQPEAPSTNAGVRTDNFNELEQAEVMDSDPEPQPETTRVFKRLRRGIGAGAAGPTSQSLPPLSMKKQELQQRSCCDNGDDEIEEFSSQEDLRIGDEHPTLQHQSVCSSSKIPLRGHGVLTTQSLRKTEKREQTSDAPSSASFGTSLNGLMFPKLTISPLRRFQLLDSDSDSDCPSVCEDVSIGSQRISMSSKEAECTTSEQKRKLSADMNQTEDLWKDFCPLKSFRILTPALDEVCEEYFESVKGKSTAQSDGFVSNGRGSYPNTKTCEDFEQCWDSADPIPPSHRYFFHNDSRIQKLVQSRLPNFSPLGIVANRRNQQPNASVIDYMCQFSNGDVSKQKGTQKINVNKSSTKGRNKSKKSNTEDLHASEGWVDPKSSTAFPKDAGKRRVHANGQSAGHWYTSPEGRKVYVSKSGQELTGQLAYRQYRKESGAGFKKSKKKTSTKNKRARG